MCDPLGLDADEVTEATEVKAVTLTDCVSPSCLKGFQSSAPSVRTLGLDKVLRLWYKGTMKVTLSSWMTKTETTNEVVNRKVMKVITETLFRI